MNTNKIMRIIKITTLALFIVFFGCSSPLLEVIKEEVAIVIMPPGISTLFPDADSIGNSISLDDILLTFSKQIDTSSVDGSTFIIEDSEGNIISGSYSVSNDTISFNPSSNLSYNMIYTVTAKEGILDVDGNPMGAEFSWNFKTEEAPSSIKPIVKYARINNGQSATKETTVTLEISATDSYGYTQNLKARYKTSEESEWSSWEDLSEGLISIADIPLDVSESGDIFIFDVEVKDASNIISDIAQENIIYELTPPSITDVNWDDESTYSFNSSYLRITFDDEMDISSFSDLNFYVERVSDSQKLTGMINLIDSDTSSNRIVNLWGLSLDPNTLYKVTLGNDVSDIAGNLIGGEINEWFFTTSFADGGSAPDGSITLDNIGYTVLTLPEGVLATGNYQIQLDLADITDDYHDVVQMKFWGDSSAGYVSEPAWESYATTKTWNVSDTSGVKILSYNFKDSYDISYDDPRHLQVLLDKTNPDNPAVTVNGGTGLFTNNTEGKVTIAIDSSDTYSGLYQMDINDSDRSSGWIDWSPTYDEWELQDGDGLYTFTVSARDYVNNVSITPGTATIILDRAEPVLTINTALNILVSEAETITEGSTGSDYYEIAGEGAPFGIETYYWEQIGGPGTITFSSTGVIEPSASADTDGTYYIKVTATDYAGNQSSGTIPFTWDATDPGDIGNLFVSAYDTTGQPTWTWDAVGDADFYRTSYVSNFSSYIDVYTNSFTPNTPLTPDGTKTLYVRAQDFAGNSSLELNASVHVDTTAPTISVTNSDFVANGDTPQITIDYDAGPHGTVADNGTNPSGLDTYSWTQIGGSGTISFGLPSELMTTVSANSDDNYQLRLTVTDVAGNSTFSDFSLLRDITDPGDPEVFGFAITPSINPGWYWNSGGDGNGTFEFRLYNETDATLVEDWTEISDVEYQQLSPSLSTDTKLYRFDLRERDIAGNWSDITSFYTTVDVTATTPPQISINGGGSTLRNVNNVTWDVLTGSGGIATDYRYYFDGSGTWIYEGTNYGSSPLHTVTPVSFPRTDLDDGTYSITIEEYFNNQWQTGKQGTHIVTIDITEPTPPILNSPGNNTLDSDRKATNDTTPTWTWSGGGGGNGRFKYKLTHLYNASGSSVNNILVNWTGETTQTNYTYGSVLANGTYKLEVMERDDAGNWSDVNYIETTVDNLFPTLSGVRIEGTSRYDDSDFSHTRNATVNVRITGNINSEANSVYDRPVAIDIYDYNEHLWDDYSSPFNESNPTEEVISVILPSTQGSRKVYIRLRDEAGNTTSYIYDDIILDTIAPTGTFLINNGETYTPSLTFKMNLDFTDNLSQVTDFLVRTYDSNPDDGDGYEYQDYRPYSALMTSDFDFSKSAGSKYSRVLVYDSAGNYANIYDNITLQVAEPQYAWKGNYTSGASRVYYTPVTEDGGANTTRYYTYSIPYNTYILDPTFDPNTDPTDAAALTYRGYTTSTTYDYFSIPAGELNQIFIRAYNSDTGGYGPYSDTSVLAFGGNVTVIYDKGDPDDEARAEKIRAILEDDADIVSESLVEGTMPTWTVTLLPEDLISNTYSEWNKIYGDPIIITQGVSNTTGTTYDGRVRNIASSGRGIITMGSAGGYFLYRVEQKWTTWGLTGTSPSNIDSMHQMGLSASLTAKSRPYSTSESIWFTPLYNTVLYNSYYNSSIGMNIFYSGNETGRRGVNISGGANPPDGYIYAADNASSAHFPVVRQGRFLFYGYYEIPDYIMTGQMFLVNLVARMDNF